MLSRIVAKQIYRGDYGWHVGCFHFSFADYVDPENTRFGDLITFNDFYLQPKSGFETHSHQEIEIISYCVAGELVHDDNLGNKEIIKRGEIQYTCAGSGITHSEKNESMDQPLRFIQIWLRPNAPGLTPYYRSTHYKPSDRHNKLLQVVSGKPLENSIQINQDANIFIAELEAGRQIGLPQLSGRQVYLTCLEGVLDINDLHIETGDAVKVCEEPQLKLLAVQDCHFLMVELPEIR
jgi:redox-sensitive bicupin YhaK (pirin superfamily)